MTSSVPQSAAGTGSRPGQADPGVPGLRLLELVQVMDTLRRNCPWDARQTHASLMPYLLEETYEALDAFAAVLPPRPHVYRHRIEHAQMATRAQLDRMAALGVLPSFFVGHVHYYGDRHHDRYLGPTRGSRISPVQEAVEAGLLFSLHSDCPVTPLDPLHSIRVAVERKTPGGRTLGPALRARAETAFLAYTRWAAYLGLREQSIGSLDPGRLADFTVLDGNPLEWRPDAENTPIGVVSTWVGGEERYRA